MGGGVIDYDEAKNKILYLQLHKFDLGSGEESEIFEGS